MSTPESNSPESAAPYGGGTAQQVPLADRPRVRISHLQAAKDAGEHFAMLTSYDTLTAQIFDEAGVEVLLVGDSAGNNVLGYSTTLPVTMEEMILFTRAVTSGATKALVIADLPFGSYEESPEQAVRAGVRLMKEGGAHAVKMEGGAHFVPHVEAMVAAGVPVMAHIGFTPQSEHALGGYKVQGRGDAAQKIKDDADALARAGAFSVLMEMVPSPVAAEVDRLVPVPTVGIGAGASTTGQVLVWQDMAGMRAGRMPKFVKQYAQLRADLLRAAGDYARDVRQGTFPDADHEFQN